jgi:3-deoxy-D-manno-octulosonic-acid transferase
METEIWPNLFTLCNKQNLAIRIINARLSKKTTAANRWIKALLKYSLSKVSAIYARSDANAQSYQQLGADADIIQTTGNLKIATARPAVHSGDKIPIAIDRDYVLLASTHDDEERQFYKLWQKLERPELLVIAPRHPERGVVIIKQTGSNNIAVRSRQQKVTQQTDIFLLDSVGELKSLFKKAKLVVMGGSFTPIGGHNILEPASYNRAIITGPYMDNFSDELALMLEKNAIIQVASYDELLSQMQQLLDNDELRETLQNNTARLSHNAEKILEDYSSLILDTK